MKILVHFFKYKGKNDHKFHRKNMLRDANNSKTTDHSFSKCLLSVHHVSGAVLGATDIAVNERDTY